MQTSVNENPESVVYVNQQDNKGSKVKEKLA